MGDTWCERRGGGWPASLGVGMLVVLALGPAFGLGCARDPAAKKQAHYERAEKYYADGKYSEAVIELRNALAIDPNMIPALRALARAYRVKSWDEDAARELSRAARLDPSSLPIQAELGRTMVALEDWESANGIGETIAGADPKHPYGPYLRGTAASGREDPDTGLPLLVEALRLGPGLPEIQQAYGEALARAKRYEEAERAFRAVLAQNPKDVDALAALGLAQLKRGSIDTALETVTRARAIDHDNARARLARSTVLSAQGKWAEAAWELESLSRQAWTPRFQIALGEVYLRNDRPESALSVLDPLAKRFPGYTLARYLTGHAALGANRPEKAISEFQEVVRQAPTNVNGRFSLAVAYSQAGQAGQALDLFTALRSAMDSQPVYHIQRAQALARLARWDEAIIAAETARKLDPASSEPYEMLGRIYLGRKDLVRAQKMYARAIEVKPDFTAARLALGQLYDFNRDPDAALREYEAALQSNPRSQVAVVSKVNSLVRAGRHDEAIAFLLGLMKAQGETAPFLTILGHVYLAKGDIPKGEAEFHRAIRINETYPAARFALARLALASSKEQQAIVHLHQVLVGAPGHAPAGIALAALYSRETRYDQAIQVLEPIARANSRQPEVALQLAELYLQKGRYDAALSAVEPFLRSDSEMVPARMVAGLAHLGRSEPGEAVKDFERVTRANPKLALGHYYLGRAFLARGELEAARKSYQRALEIDPRLTQVRIELAAVSGQALDNRLLAQHIGDLRKGLEREPADVSTRYALARAYLATGQVKEAEAEFKRILDGAPGFAPANMAMAMLRLSERRGEEAVEYLRAVVRTTPTDAQAHLILANYYDQAGNAALAIEHLEAALRAAPSRNDAKLRLAALYARADRIDDAVGRAREVIEAQPQLAEARYVLGDALLRRGDTSEALETFAAAVRLDPKHAAAQLGLGIAHEQRGEIDRALHAYARARALAPGDARAYNNSAWILAVQGRSLDDALALARKATELVAKDKELAPWAPAMIDTLGYVHMKRGDYAQAEVLLRDATRRAPNVATYHYHLAVTYERLGRRDDARVAALRATRLDQKLGDDPEVQSLLKRVGG